MQDRIVPVTGCINPKNRNTHPEFVIKTGFTLWKWIFRFLQGLLSQVLLKEARQVRSYQMTCLAAFNWPYPTWSLDLLRFMAKRIWSVGGADILWWISILYIQQAQSRFLFWIHTWEYQGLFWALVVLCSLHPSCAFLPSDALITLLLFNGILLLYNYARSLTAMENIRSAVFNCFIIMTIITNEDLPEVRAKRGFYSLSSTCHHNKRSLEISPVLYFKGLCIQEFYLCILSGWLLLQ